MAASSSHDASGSAPADRFRLLRELGSRAVPTWAALESLPGGRTNLVVVERIARGGEYGDQEIADWVRDARRIATLEHPNIARVRDVLIRGEDVLVASEFVDGVRWSELVAQPVPLELTLRVFLDVLSGLSALHNLRDAKRQPLKLVHGELTPECVVVGIDGVARVVASCRAKSPSAQPGRTGTGYLAPEVLLADDSADVRADLFSVGVMLWEALSGRALFEATAQPSAIVTRVLGGHLPPATVPAQTPWAAPLAGLVARAMFADPQKRFASAPDMAAELRKIAGPKLAPSSRVAAHLRASHGDYIRLRREHLERAATPPPEVSRIEPQLGSSPEGERVTPSNAPTPVPPPPPSRAKEPPAPAGPAQQPPAPRPPPPLARPAPSLPQAPPKPPPVPLQAEPLRPRHPTLNGMAAPSPQGAPQGPAAGAVPQKQPAPPDAAAAPFGEDSSSVHLPAAPRVPKDLAAAALAMSGEAPHRSPARPIARVETDGALALAASEPSPHRKRALLVGAIAAPALIVVALVWWAASRPGARVARSSARSSPPATNVEGAATTTPAALAPVRAEPSAPVAVAPEVPPGGGPAVVPSPRPVATQLLAQPAPPPDGPSGRVAPTRVTAPGPGAAVSPPRPSPAASAPPPPRRRTRTKYEPEGI